MRLTFFSCQGLFKKIIFSDTKKQLLQEVEERLENIALLTDADKEINLKFDLKFESHDNEFQNLKTVIEDMAITIESLKSADNELTTNQKDNALRFHVETKQDGGVWPHYTLITYNTKLTDTHNAMNTETGFFTAPFLGTFGFVFYGGFYCDGATRYLYIDHNGARSTIYKCHGNTAIDESGSSIYFAISLKQGDEVGIFVETANVRLGSYPAKFTGFLLKKN